jgi:DTW domain-containing protein YfiP
VAIAAAPRTAYAQGMTDPVPCPKCLKPPALCICDNVAPFTNRVTLLVLQHPQEQDVELGTARLAAAHFSNAVFKVGLSWPSLTKALGRGADPKRWAVLYLGSAKTAGGAEVMALDRTGNPLPDQNEALRDLQGVIVLDGSWSQAKALWWRNAWLLKCRRMALNPRQPSKYGKLRREARRDALSTIEAVALLMGRVEQKPGITSALYVSFTRMLDRYRASRKSAT